MTPGAKPADSAAAEPVDVEWSDEHKISNALLVKMLGCEEIVRNALETFETSLASMVFKFPYAGSMASIWKFVYSIFAWKARLVSYIKKNQVEFYLAHDVTTSRRLSLRSCFTDAPPARLDSWPKVGVQNLGKGTV